MLERDMVIRLTVLGGIVLVLVLAIVALWRLAAVRRGLRQAEERAAGLAQQCRQAEERTAGLAQQYGGVIDIEGRIAAERRALQAIQDDTAQLRAAYAQKRALFDELNHEVTLLTGRLDLAELGLYEPNPALGASATYTAALERNRAQQKDLMAGNVAAICSTDWAVDGDRRKGQTMATRAIRLTLRAFNNECEVLIGKISWSNLALIKEG